MQTESSQEARVIQVDFCANPKPSPRGVYWLIGDERVNTDNNQVGHYKALPVKQVSAFQCSVTVYALVYRFLSFILWRETV